jgi:arylformamidase
MDAPYHFRPDGATLEDVDLYPFWGPARVVTVVKEHGPLVPADLPDPLPDLPARLLIRTSLSGIDPGNFPGQYCYPAPALAEFLASRGVVLLGTDAPSMDEEHSDRLEGHRALLKHGIAILEWLDLSQAADGLYELAALPLCIVGGDGSPVRAALRPWAGCQSSRSGWRSPGPATTPR